MAGLTRDGTRAVKWIWPNQHPKMPPTRRLCEEMKPSGKIWIAPLKIKHLGGWIMQCLISQCQGWRSGAAREFRPRRPSVRSQRGCDARHGGSCSALYLNAVIHYYGDISGYTFSSWKGCPSAERMEEEEKEIHMCPALTARAIGGGTLLMLYETRVLPWTAYAIPRTL